MDFKSLTGKLGDFANKALAQGKEALAKTTDFTYENLKKTNVIIRSGGDFDKLHSEKKLVVFVLSKDEVVSKNILVQLPLIYSKAWTNTVTLRFILADENPELLAIFELSSPGVAYYRSGDRQFNLSEETEINEFVKTFDLAMCAPKDSQKNQSEDLAPSLVEELAQASEEIQDSKVVESSAPLASEKPKRVSKKSAS